MKTVKKTSPLRPEIRTIREACALIRSPGHIVTSRHALATAIEMLAVLAGDSRNLDVDMSVFMGRD